MTSEARIGIKNIFVWAFFITGILAIVAAGLIFCVASDAKQIRVKECPVCRAQRKTISWFGLKCFDFITSNRFTTWYSSNEPPHLHIWIPRASMGYNCFGSVRSSGLFRQYRFFVIEPEDEEAFLQKNFPPRDIEMIARHLTNSTPSDALYFALYGTNTEASLNQLRFWLQTNVDSP